MLAQINERIRVIEQAREESRRNAIVEDAVLEQRIESARLDLAELEDQRVANRRGAETRDLGFSAALQELYQLAKVAALQQTAESNEEATP